MAGGGNARQRARMQARLASRAAMRALEDEEKATAVEPHLKGAGAVEGSAFDWEQNLYVDPDTKALYDGGDQEARDIREALGADWKMRQLAELLTSSIRKATWKLVPGDVQGTSVPGTEAERIAKQTEERLRRPANAGGMTTPINRVIGQAASSRIYRRAYFAKGFRLDGRTRDGAVLYSQLAMRPASTCRPRVDPVDGSFDGFVQDIVYFADNSHRWDGRPVIFKPRQALVFTNGLDKDPVSGVSDLEVAMWCFRAKRKVIALWLTYLSAQALPRTLVKYTGGDEAKARKAAEMIASLSSGGVGYIDATNIEVDTIDPSGKGPQSFVEMVKYLDTCQSGSVLAGFTDLTSAAADGKGSYALHEGATDVFSQATEHAATELEDVLTNYCVADLVRYNEADLIVPTWKFDPLAGVDEGPLMALLQALATAQSSALPQEFINELAIHAARLLDLDVDKIGKALLAHAAAAKQAAEDQGANAAGQQAAGVNGAVEGLRGIAREVAGRPPARRPLAIAAGGAGAEGVQSA